MDRTRKNLQGLEHSQLIILYLDKQAECNQLKEQLARVKTKAVPKIKYQTNWNWTQKIVFALTQLDKPSLSSQILEMLEKYDDHFDYYNDKEKSFSHFMTKSVINEVVIKYKIGGFRGFHYILPEWCDETGELMKTYKNKISLL